MTFTKEAKRHFLIQFVLLAGVWVFAVIHHQTRSLTALNLLFACGMAMIIRMMLRKR